MKNIFEMNLQQLEQELVKQALFELAVSIAILILLFWALYAVIKAGVRDGIREAAPRDRSHQRPAAPPGFKWALVKEAHEAPEMPEIRAER